MRMDKVAGSKNDEFYTPDYAIEPLLKYIRPKSVIWCPFDTADSGFVRLFERAHHSVISTHICDGYDFFDLDVPCDYIISNPPYSRKGDVLQRLFDLDRPFAMLVGVVGLFESRARFDMFRSHDFEILYFDKRIAYFRDRGDRIPSLHPPFSSVYVCHKVLPRQIVFEEVDK